MLRFIVKNKSFTQQFSHVYNKRLLGLKAAVHRAAEERWGGGGGAKGSSKGGVKFVDRLVNMKEGDEWVVIGTTYKVGGKRELARACTWVGRFSAAFLCEVFRFRDEVVD